jgi:hypothetical protein
MAMLVTHDPTATLIVSCRDVQYAHIPNAL